MAFQLSPGVLVSEVDLTTVVPSVLTTAGAFAGGFSWGPANKRILIDSEITLVKRFGQPDNTSATDFFTAASFLAYGNNLSVVRAANNATFNAVANTSASSVQISNEDVFEATYLYSNNHNSLGAFAARYPGALGNSLKISVCDNPGFGTWDYKSYFSTAPGTSAQAITAGGIDDEMHIIVIDAEGLFTGSKNAVLETFAFVSKAFDAVDSLGNSNYYKNVVYKQSKYIYAVDPVQYDTASTTWGLNSGTTFTTLSNPVTVNLQNGTSTTTSDGDYQRAYSLFTNGDEIDISLVITGAASIATQQFAIDNIASARKDCVAFISPPASAVVNNLGNEANGINDWTSSLARSSSYAVADSGWKYMFDKYNNIYRWVPLNGDIAGLCVYTDTVRDPWFSPAGFNRGNLKNVVKLSWNPNKTERDKIYSLGVNPVATFPGQGTVLYGDKTLQTKPSAFDRINVRRLFIVLEKAIARASRYSLFEFNDEFSRGQFVALVTPFLRDIQGRRGIYDYKVVCDTTNNTGEVIDSNQFVGDIYIKPARSINFIQLNFVAVRTGVDFTEVVGKF
jgi:phage tail sheath protein FI